MKYSLINPGDKLQMFTVIKELPGKTYANGRVNRMLLCKCECGTVKSVGLDGINYGATKSCGCYQKLRARQSNSSHGLSGTPIYNTYMKIISRTTNKKDQDFKDYGGRGIINEWGSFEAFYKDMGDIPSKDHSIDRIDPNGNYSKENCRWATPAMQSRNKRSNIVFKKECAADASTRLGGNRNLVTDRISRGWSISKAFTTPVVQFDDITIAGDVEAIKAKADTLN